MSGSAVRFERVRLLTRGDEGSGCDGGEIGYLEATADGISFRVQPSVPGIDMRWSDMSAAQAMGPLTARQHVTDTGIALDGVEPNFWTAFRGPGSFLFIERPSSPTLGFHLRATAAARLQVALAPWLPHVAAPPETTTTGATPDRATVTRDLTHLADDQRQILADRLVSERIAHNMAGGTLTVAADAESALARLIGGLQAPESLQPPPATNRDTSQTEQTTGRAGTEGNPQEHPGSTADHAPQTDPDLGHFTEYLSALERLIAVRDAGGLTPDEFEAARAHAVRRLLVQDDD